jgi:hypothetical protein
MDAAAPHLSTTVPSAGSESSGVPPVEWRSGSGTSVGNCFGVLEFGASLRNA